MAALETIILDIPGVTSGCFGNVCCISYVLIFFLFVCLFDDYLHSSLTQFNAGADPGFQVGGGGGAPPPWIRPCNVHNKNNLMDVYFCRISRLWYKCSLYEADILLWKRAFTSMQRDDLYMHCMYYLFSLYSSTLYTL